MRAVSLVPSSTETLLALGADVVACTRFCEQPEIRHVGGPKNPDVAAIAELRPDVVVLDRQENRIEDAVELERAGLELFVSDVRTVDAALALVADLAELIGKSVGPLAVPDVAIAPMTAFVPIWRRPWMSIGSDTYGASVLARLGCRLVTDAEVHYPVVDLDDVAAAGPDVVLVPSEPYDFAPAHLDELRAALPDVAMELVDGQDLFWWGIRTPAAIGRLAAALDHVPG
ncbi:MAG: helical backbone metal receptor [Ilumatobacteraceae bacterium]